MSRAEELAQAYADAVSTHRLESLYGTSKSYTLEKSRERDEAHSALTAELRRLAQVEAEHEALKKAISDAVPVSYLIERHSFYASQHGQDAEGRDWLEVTDQKEVGSFPVYTLEGIRK